MSTNLRCSRPPTRPTTSTSGCSRCRSCAAPPISARGLGAPLPLGRWVAAAGRLPVVLFCAGGIATPADAALVMQLGAEGVFVGSGIFKSEDPERRANAIVEATTHFQDPAPGAGASTGLGQPMVSLETSKLESEQLLAPRGWELPADVPLVGILA